MEQQYIPLSHRDSLDSESTLDLTSDKSKSTYYWHTRGGGFILKPNILTSFLLFILIVESYFLNSAILENKKDRTSPRKSPSKRKALLTNTYIHIVGLSTARSVERKLYEPTVYMSKNRTEADYAWESINTGHGLVAIDKKWASEHKIVQSMTFPFNPEQSLYVIEAYHAIHCIVSPDLSLSDRRSCS
jgi:hypothetical protein